MMMTMSGKVSVVDFIVFGVTLVVPVAIALYYSCVKKQKTTNAVFLADRSLSALPISFSLAVSYLSTVTITGIPGEIAYHGWLFPWTWLLASTLSLIIVGNLFIPIFYKMRLTSVYEYLELRYNSRVVRLMASFSYIVSIILYMGVVLYTPCLALHTITGLPEVALILLGGIVATIYTVMGGLKTVVWTDLFQGLIMLSGLGVILGRGLYMTGGVTRMWEIAVETQRVEWFNWDPSPFTRNTTLGIFCGQFVLWGAIFGCHQTQVQRYCSTRSLSQARWALTMSVLLIWLVVGSAIFVGLVVFANYWSCDPKMTGIITKKDELVTQFVLDHLVDFVGIPGIFIASLLCGALSTISSGLNSLAAVVWEDMVKPMSWSVGITDGRQVFLTRAIAAFMGLITVGLAVITANLDGVLQLGNTAMGVLAGPLLAVFLLGFFTTAANKYGAVIGILCGNAFTIWLLVGSLIKPLPKGPSIDLPTFKEGCGMNSTQRLELDVVAIAKNHSRPQSTFFYIPEGDWDDILYSTSYHLYALSGFLICLIVCLFVSLMARLCMRQYRPVEPLLLHPLVRSKDSLTAMAELARHHHPHPYVLSQFQPYYGGGGHGRNQYPGVPSSNGDWDDTHYRWPSPSLPPTLKKTKHFGTLDKGKDLMMLRHSSPEKTSSTNSGGNHGRINYGFSRNEDYQLDKKHSDQFSTSSTNDSDDMTIDDFGDVVKRPRSKSKSSSSSKRSGSKQRTIVRQSTDEEDDEDGWTTEF